MKFLQYNEVVTRIESKQDLNKIFMAAKPTDVGETCCSNIPDIIFKPLGTKTICEITKDDSIFIDISEE